MSRIQSYLQSDNQLSGAMLCLLIAALTLLLVSCSRIQLAYTNLDWLMSRKLASYMPLSDTQNKLLKTNVKHFLDWHCSTQLRRYSQLLHEANSRFQSNNLTRDELLAFNKRIEQGWTSILQQAAPLLADILLTADDDQTQKLFKGFEKRNSKWQKEFDSKTPKEHSHDYYKRMHKELRRWFGKLGKQQRQTLTEWSRQFKPLGHEGLTMRQRWQDYLRKIMSNRDDPDAFRRAFASLLDSPEELRTRGYLQRTQANHAVTIDMLYAIIRRLDAKQKQHLRNKVRAVAGDFDELACSGDTRTLAMENILLK